MNLSLTPRTATLTRSTELAPEHRLMIFEDSAGQAALPGQFFMVSLPGIGEFPVSIAGSPGGGLFETCIRRAGRVTAALFRQPEGTRIGLRGPYGNGFPLPAFASRDALLIAGGLGIAPMRGLLQGLLDAGAPPRSVTLLYGARDPETLLFVAELRELAVKGRLRLQLAVDFAHETPWGDQPGLCRIGLVTGLLEGLPGLGEQCVAAVCGPPVLYSCVLEHLAAAGIPAAQIFATLERRMRCGVGSCCHCVTAGVTICQQGPVFSLAELRGMPGAVEGIP